MTIHTWTKFGRKKVVVSSAWALSLVLTAFGVESTESTSSRRLVGIVSSADRPCVVLEVVGPRRVTPRLLILWEGQREEGIQVVRIAPDNGSVELASQGGDKTTVQLTNTTNLPAPGVVLEEVGLNEVLYLFAMCTNRTLLRWPYLRAPSFSLRAPAKDRVGAARILAQALAAKGLSVIPDGEKFLMIVPESAAATVKPHAPPAKASPGGGTQTQPTLAGSGTAEQEFIPPGMIDFRGADVAQVADVYSELLGRKLDRSERLPVSGTISFRTQTRLTKEEAVYALETLLIWSGVKLVPAGEDKLKAVRAWGN
jgi:hypothetical protein